MCGVFGILNNSEPVCPNIAPPIRYPNVYGIDIQKSEDLIAYNKSEQEIASLLGIKQVIYNDLDDIINACSSLQNNKIEFETCCFDGIYFDVKYN